MDRCLFGAPEAAQPTPLRSYLWQAFTRQTARDATPAHVAGGAAKVEFAGSRGLFFRYFSAKIGSAGQWGVFVGQGPKKDAKKDRKVKKTHHLLEVIFSIFRVGDVLFRKVFFLQFLMSVRDGICVDLGSVSGAVGTHFGHF